LLQWFLRHIYFACSGWLWPFEEYYHKYTGGIITTAIKALKKNPSRKFIWAEVSFFELWWQHASSTMQQDARDVVKSGQFEFVTAGWVMNDEANCHIFAILEQLYEGREFVERTFGVKPTTGYAVDPFGQSAVMAQVLKRMGYDAMYINRVQYAVKRVLAEKHNMDFIWRQHWDKTGTTDMITHMHPFFNYDVPHSCGPQPGVCCQFDFLRLETSGMTCPWGVKPEPISRANVHAKAQLYLDQIFKKATLFGGRAGHSNAVLVPIGGDLEYQHDSIAEKMFTNYEALFEHINNDPSFNVNIQFGTLADYFAAVKKQHSAESNLRVVGGPSFFTYADKDEEYWSGYYTSRPFYKSINRELESLVHAAEFLSASFLRTGQAYQSEIQSGLQKARRAMALFQHHDAITGTSKHATMNDYGSRLYDGVKSMQCLINTAIERLASKQLGVHLAGLQPAHVRATATGLPQRMLLQFPDGGAARVVTVFNPTGRTRVSLLIQPVDSAEVCIRDADGTLKPTQINPMYSLDLGVRQSGGYEAVYPVEVPAFAVKVVELVRDSKCKSPMVRTRSLIYLIRKHNRSTPTR
jgi:alpha-mannosidase II